MRAGPFLHKASGTMFVQLGINPASIAECDLSVLNVPISAVPVTPPVEANGAFFAETMLAWTTPTVCGTYVDKLQHITLACYEADSGKQVARFANEYAGGRVFGKSCAAHPTEATTLVCVGTNDNFSGYTLVNVSVSAQTITPINDISSYFHGREQTSDQRFNADGDKFVIAASSSFAINGTYLVFLFLFIIVYYFRRYF